MIKIDVGIFAHNEALRIENMLRSILLQDLLFNPSVSLRLLVLANGCTDRTAPIADSVLSPFNCETFEVVNIANGGKSRTWNCFVHDVSRPDADVLCFCDADIMLPDPACLSRLLELLSARPDLEAVQSRPVKDTSVEVHHLRVVDRLITASGQNLDDWRHSICGQLYMAKAQAVRAFHLPIGLPVEDGFIRAMLVTRVFTESENLDLIDGREDAFHVYASERSIGALIRHQMRIVIGSAINSTLFRILTEPEARPAQEILAEASVNEGWVSQALRDRLPSWRFGWVPWHFLTKRVVRFRRSRSEISLRSILLLFVGFGFDALVFFLAQMKMARGVGVGYW